MEFDKLFGNVDAANANTNTQIVIYCDVNIFEIHRSNDDDDDDDASLNAFCLDFQVWKKIPRRCDSNRESCEMFNVSHLLKNCTKVNYKPWIANLFSGPKETASFSWNP